MGFGVRASVETLGTFCHIVALLRPPSLEEFGVESLLAPDLSCSALSRLTMAMGKA